MTEDKLQQSIILQQKVLFCDIDGTLIDDEKEIAPESIKALQELINNHPDYHFALASGRSLADELILYRKMGLKNTGLLIGSNGSQIYALKSHKIVREITVPNAISQEIYDYLMQQVWDHNKNLLLMVNYADSSVFLFNFPEEMWKNYHMGEVKLRNEFSNERVLLWTVMFLKDDTDAFINKFGNILGLKVIPGPNLTAITGIGASKEDAIKWVKDYYNLEYKNIAVLGDSKNDVGMFSLPDVYKLTYKDAKSYLKELADVVINQPKSVFIKEAVLSFEKHINENK